VKKADGSNDLSMSQPEGKWSDLKHEDKLFIGAAAEEAYRAYVAERRRRPDAEARGKLSDAVCEMASGRGIQLSRRTLKSYAGKFLLRLANGRQIQKRLKKEKLPGSAA